MSLRFIFGGAGSGKTYTCIEEIYKSKENGCTNPLILLVPEQLSFKAEKLLVEKIGVTGINNVYVLSFKRMAYTIFNEVGGIAHINMNTTGKAMIIDRILNEVQSELRVFSLASKQQGFVDTIIEAINEFKRYNVTVEILNGLKENVSENNLLLDKISDIALIYENYENILKKGYFDPEDDLTLLYEKIDNSNFFKNAEIWIDEFSGFTPQQYKIIEKLLKLCKRVNVTLPYRGASYKLNDKNIDENDAFYSVFYTENKILKIASENNIAYEKPLNLEPNDKNGYNYRFINSDELGFLEKNYFSLNNKVYSKDMKDIKIFKALNNYSEIEYVAKEIISECRENKYRFKDIAVVTRNLDGYESVIKAIFKEYNIPYFLDKKKDIDTNPVIILVKSVLDILDKNFTYESVFRYLKSGLLNLDFQQIDKLENYVLQYGIRGKNKYINDDYWKDESIKEYKNNFLIPILNLKEHIKKDSTVREIIIAIFNFLEEIKLPDKIDSLVDRFKEEENLNLANEYSTIWNLLMELFDQFVEVLGDEVISLSDFISIFTMGIATQEIGLIPPAIDQVTIGNINRIKTHDIKLLYVIGTNDGVFPKVNSEEGIFNDMDRMTFESNGVEISKDTNALAFEEQFLIYATLTLPSDKLCLTYSIADFEGKALRQSIIISRIKSLFKNLKEENDINISEENNCEIDKIISKTPTFNDLIMKIKDYIKEENISDVWIGVLKYFMEDEEYRRKSETIFKGFSYSNIVDAINSEKIKKLYDGGKYFTVSKIEKYTQCPFAYFVQYGLKAKERKIFNFSAPDIGSFIHEVLDIFSKKVSKSGVKWKNLTDQYCIDEISKIVEDLCNKDNNFILNSSKRYKYITERLKRVLIKSTIVIINQLRVSEFEPYGYEVSFGIENSDYPPIEVELPNGEIVKLIGRIDRIDRFINNNEVYYRVVDYKSGNKEFKLSDVYYGLQIQLLIYLDAILNSSENEQVNSKPAGIFYFKVDDPIISFKKDMSDEDIEKEILKQLKLKGIMIDDLEIIREMDTTLKSEKSSLVIPAEIKNDGNLSSKSSVISYKGFENLRNHVIEELGKTCENMLQGEIAINPYKNGKDNPCGFCELSSICQFDSSFEENKYRLLGKKKDKEILKLLEAKGEDDSE